MVTSAKYVRWAVQVFLVVFAAFLLIAGEPFSSTFKAASRVSSAVPIALLLFETWIWHWPWLQRWSWFPVPDLRGTWEGVVESTFERDGVRIPPIETYIVIRQSLLNISVRQFTVESSSELLSGGICRDSDGACHVNGIFLNTPLAGVRDRSHMAHGAFIYKVSDRPVKRLHGNYWTDRKTDGDAAFTARVSKVADGFEECQGLFRSSSNPAVAVPVGEEI